MTLSLPDFPPDNSISPADIHTVHHLIEKCLQFYMDQEECVSSLEKHANVRPAVTRIVWNELEKSNREFFIEYRKTLAARGSSQGSSQE